MEVSLWHNDMLWLDCASDVLSLYTQKIFIGYLTWLTLL
jgi:hypothetical protein